MPGRLRSSVLLALIISGSSVAAATITVTSTADSGGTCPGATCTLRQAIAAAAAGATINFSLPANSVVTLTSGELSIDKDLTISGPGANLLSVKRSTANHTPAFRIFNITGDFTVAISGLKIANGIAPAGSTGGGIIARGRLTLTGATISGNTATAGGGGIVNDGLLTISGSTISGNTVSSTTVAGSGGGILNGNTVTITNSTISGNSAIGPGGNSDSGGGLFTAGGGTVTLTNCTITGNSADIGGGVRNIPDPNNANAVIRAQNTIIALNSAPAGPDIYGALTSDNFNLIGNSSGATITPSQSSDQIGVTAAQLHLGPLQDNGGPTFTHALLSGSFATEKGNSSSASTDQRGLPRPVDSPSLPNATDGDGSDIGAYEVQADQLPGCGTINHIVKNKNDSGADSLRGVIANVCNGSTITFADNVRGAINLTSGQLVIDKSLTVNGPGANLLTVQRSFADGTPDFRVFTVAPASNGRNNVTISGLTISNGVTPDSNGGGGIYSQANTLTISNCTISANTGLYGGGGIVSADGNLIITNSTITGNTSTNLGFNHFDAVGGGIAVHSAATIINSTLSGNVAAGDGGGIYVGASLTLTNSTVTDNHLSRGTGGGVSNHGGVVNARNTIIAGNTVPSGSSGSDFSGALNLQGYDLIGNTSGTTITGADASDQFNVDPMLDTLKDNGGPTFTHALRFGSPAIDKGHSSGLTTDQRGFARPINQPTIANASGGDGGDIGAFELQVPSATPTPTATPKPTSTPTHTPTPTPTPKPTATPTAPAVTLGNISTRSRVETGNNVLIGGFIVTGTEPKKVLIRALGPSLPVSGALGNPVLELYRGKTLLERNDNWVNSPNKQAIIDTTIPPPKDLESAIVATLPGNNTNYTAVVRGANNTTGVGQVEVYDLDRAVNSKLANISTRGLVQTGDNVMIGGFIVLGYSSQKVLIRALGPSLPVSGALADPFLELHNANGTVLRANDDWKSDQRTQIEATTIPPPKNAESAIVATLAPAKYTAVVRGVNQTTGVALVEVYALQ